MKNTFRLPLGKWYQLDKNISAIIWNLSEILDINLGRFGMFLFQNWMGRSPDKK